MKLQKINISDLIFSGSIEDDRTNTYLSLNDYDWMHYSLKTRFVTKEMGVLYVEFEYFGMTTSTMTVEQIIDEKKEIASYEYSSDIFKKYIIKFLEKHISQWDDKYAFNGEEEVVAFFNDVVENGSFSDGWTKFKRKEVHDSENDKN